jgi:hypothetical protein
MPFKHSFFFCPKSGFQIQGRFLFARFSKKCYYINSFNKLVKFLKYFTNNFISRSMKKIILNPKALTLVFLFFGILAVLIPTVMVLGSGINLNQPSARITPDGVPLPIDLKGQAINSTNICVTNNNSAGKSYLVPYKTTGEWTAFTNAANGNSSLGLAVGPCCGDDLCNNGETLVSCSNDCAALSCDDNLYNIYTSAVYSAGKHCGYMPSCSVNGSQVSASYIGSNCTVGVDHWQYQQCAVLFKTAVSRVCQGDPCIVGIDHSDYYNPGICIGYYDHTLKTCVYTRKSVEALPSWGGTSGISYSPTSPTNNSGPYASWGTCATTPVCGNSICDSGYGESCSNCPDDCGPCPTPCGNYYNIGDCQMLPQCEWNYSSGVCYNYAFPY